SSCSSCSPSSSHHHGSRPTGRGRGSRQHPNWLLAHRSGRGEVGYCRGSGRRRHHRSNSVIRLQQRDPSSLWLIGTKHSLLSIIDFLFF
ncbi:hypothetical protein PFISCL1PPCAC_753, partial [Pristionchus fissidentatus]